MSGIGKYIDVAFPGLRDKIRGTENLIPISSVRVDQANKATSDFVSTHTKNKPHPAGGSRSDHDIERERLSDTAPM